MTEPGIYFGFPEADYHAIPALSASGIKWLSVSPMDYWARCQWLNPDFALEDDSEFQELGTAYHVRILEGREEFYRRYAPALNSDDYPDALRTADEIKAALREMELKTGGNKDVLIARLLDADPNIQIWDELVKEHAGKHPCKIFLRATAIRRIEIAAAMIENHPDLSRCFRGGIPELTAVWTDEEFGVPCKARIDYLKARALVDLKTFSNPLGKSIDAAIYNAIASRKYYVQAAHYLEAPLKRLVKEGRVFGEGDRDMLAKVEDDPQWVFVFQQTGIAPLARGKVFPAGMVRDIGRQTARMAKEAYATCIKKFGNDPWIDDQPIAALDDTGFPAWLGQ